MSKKYRYRKGTWRDALDTKEMQKIECLADETFSAAQSAASHFAWGTAMHAFHRELRRIHEYKEPRSAATD
jgi:hypothetical protein